LKIPHTLNHRREVYRGRIVNLIVDEITTHQGIETIREVFQHPGGAAVVPLLDNGDVLLVRQFRYPMQEYLLELPAGKIDAGEAPDVTAARELAEEVGYSAGRLTKIAECYTTPGFCDEKLHVYLAEDLTLVQTEPDEDEELEMVRLSVDELRELIRRNQIRDAKTLIGIQHLLLRRSGSEDEDDDLCEQKGIDRA
jgi:ADP-ribose pyrophosphatase